ncbi:amidase domain-containing protein [Curtobacterium sp. RRHDQ10]|uniref:amidase domain-containing protein n=1 Tax=Curtobacterium phyllosphaerae TaxID=3413379 RepID=UPI003BF2E091
MTPPSSHPALTRRALFSFAGVAGVGLALAACSSDDRRSAGPSGTTGASSTGATTPAATPNADKLEPGTVPLAGGTTITVTGAGLAAVTAVSVGGVPATDVQASAHTVAFTLPHQATYTPGDADVVLADQGGTTLTTSTVAYAALTDVDRQLEYAMQYWQHYNTAAYGDMNPIGGDCANFVSQTLVARGWQQRADWYSRDAGAQHTTTWTYCPSMDPWLIANAATFGLTRRPLEARDEVRIGDIVMWDWNHNGSPDHVTIVSEVSKDADGTTRIKSASHNEDGPYRDLDEMITVQHPGGTAWFHTFDA